MTGGGTFVKEFEILLLALSDLSFRLLPPPLYASLTPPKNDNGPIGPGLSCRGRLLSNDAAGENIVVALVVGGGGIGQLFESEEERVTGAIAFPKTVAKECLSRGLSIALRVVDGDTVVTVVTIVVVVGVDVTAVTTGNGDCSLGSRCVAVLVVILLLLLLLMLMLMLFVVVIDSLTVVTSFSGTPLSLLLFQ